MSQAPFIGLGFVATWRNADPARIAALGVVRALAPQIAFGSTSTALPELRAWIDECRAHGLGVVPWAWCAATDEASARMEAAFHARLVRELGLDAFIANPEESYDAHGDSRSPRYRMLTAYVAEFAASCVELGLNPRALGVTSTPRFASDQTRAQALGWVAMPQAFPGEVPGATIRACVEHYVAWGWKAAQLRPLVQVYETDGVRPGAAQYLADASPDLGVVPYVVEQALDDSGIALLRALVPATMRAPANAGEEGSDVGLIGYQNGVRAYVNRQRDLDPGGTLLVKASGKWPSIDAPKAEGGLAGVPLSQWRALDKLERTLTILVADHDA